LQDALSKPKSEFIHHDISTSSTPIIESTTKEDILESGDNVLRIFPEKQSRQNSHEELEVTIDDKLYNIDYEESSILTQEEAKVFLSKENINIDDEKLALFKISAFLLPGDVSDFTQLKIIEVEPTGKRLLNFLT
jgi:hypothetical protein